MHDPMTVAHTIKYPWKSRPSKHWPNGYRSPLITIWHVDPEKDGTDDSCGWFKRPRHGDQTVYAGIQSNFKCFWDGAGGWFTETGDPKFSSQAIALGMFQAAAQVHFKSDWNKTNRFMKQHLLDILHFAENPIDSMHDTIQNRYGENREDRIKSCASMVYGCILRWTLPWYRHPRWHIHHWKLQIHPWQVLWRWMTRRCNGCGCRLSMRNSPYDIGGKPYCESCVPQEMKPGP